MAEVIDILITTMGILAPVLILFLLSDRAYWVKRAKERLEELRRRDAQIVVAQMAMADVLDRLSMCNGCPYAAELLDDRALAIAEGNWSTALRDD